MKSHPRSQSEELLASEITEFWMKALARYHRVQLQNGGKAKLISYTKDKFISSILKTGGQIHLLRDSRKKLKAAILIKSGSLMPEHHPKSPPNRNLPDQYNTEGRSLSRAEAPSLSLRKKTTSTSRCAPTHD